MKKYLCFALIFVLTMSLCSQSFASAVDLAGTAIASSAGTSSTAVVSLDEEFADNQILVVLTNEVSLHLKNYDISDFSEIDCSSVVNLTETSSNIVALKSDKSAYTSSYAIEEDHVTLNNIFDVDLDAFNQILCLTLENPGKQNVLDAINILSSREDIKYAGPNYILHIDSTTPNDTYFNLQTLPSGSIRLPQAWDYCTGSMTVEVGVLDTGIDASHPDLIDRVDVSKSRNFSDPTNITPLEAAEDYHGHGTHVAGIIAAEGNNNEGIAGVCWSVQLVSLKVAYSNGTSSVQSLIAAIDYAKSTGIPILNISLGALGGKYRSQALYDAIENYSGLVICAAGNDAEDTDTNPFYPSSHSCENIISVGSCGNSGIVSPFSNFGASTVDIFAPGEHILSCYPIEQCTLGLHDPTLHVADGYHRMSGTSMAAPYVAGVAALILSQFPNLTARQIKDRILTYVQQLPQLNNLCVTEGRLNAYLAIHIHTFRYKNTDHNSHHDCVCTICGYTIQEAHTFTSALSLAETTSPNAISLYKCTKCGYTTAQIVINSGAT